MRRVLLIVMAMAVMTAACGQSAEQKRQEEAAKQTAQAAQQAAQGSQQAAQGSEQAAQQAAKGLEQLAKGLEAMAAGAASGGKTVEPVSFREFIALFPDLDGWEKAKPTGERMSSPMPFSTAEVRYTKGDSRIEIKIMDSGFNQLLLTPYAMFLTAGYEKETSNGYEKSTKVNNEPGWEKWNSEGKDGELNALVGKRFLMTIEGNNIADIKVLHDVAGKFDMNKLASLK
jgi:uncharacterized phage infection (PIP) family protein YhgE